MEENANTGGPDLGPFGELGLRSSVVRALTQHGFRKPTALQRELIPLVLGGQDVLASAPSGTGRTVAYALPLLHLSAREQPVQGVVIVPTPEHANRAVGEFRRLGEFTPIRARSIRDFLHMMSQMSREGGGGRDRDRRGGGRDRDRRGGGGGRGGFGGRGGGRGSRNGHGGPRRTEPPHLVVGDVDTVADAVETGEIDLDRLRFLVFEDPETMLEGAMRSALDAILSSLADGQQTLIVSGDLQPGVEEALGRLLHGPARVTAGAPELSEETRKETDLAPFLAELEARRRERDARREGGGGSERGGRPDRGGRFGNRGPMTDVKPSGQAPVTGESVTIVTQQTTTSTTIRVKGPVPIWEQRTPPDPVKFPMGIAPTKPPKRVLRAKHRTRRSDGPG